MFYFSKKKIRKIFFKKLLIFFILFFSNDLYAEVKHASIELKQVTLTHAIDLLAKYLNMNVILSPSIKSDIIFDLSSDEPKILLDMLLLSHGLVKVRTGNTWLITSHNELIKAKQTALQWQQVKENAQPLSMKIWHIKYANVKEIAKLLQQDKAGFLSAQGRIHIDSRANIICIQDIFSKMKNIRDFIQAMDVPIQQIAIAARLVSIDSDYERELGLSFKVTQAYSEQQVKTNAYHLILQKMVKFKDLDVKLAALESAGHAKLISSPSLFTSNQETASIEAGEEVPYQEMNENGLVSIAFKKAVLGMKVTPKVLPKDYILLNLQINQDRPISKMVKGMPTISTRQIKTNVLVKSGQTIVLGGIFEISHEKGVMGLPLLARIPFLGWLFSEHHARSGKRELLIFVTPKLLR